MILTVRFITHTNFIGFAIREVTNSLMSHAEFLVNNQWVVAAPPRISLQPMDYTNPSWERRYGIEVPDSVGQIANDWALAQVGKNYNIADIAGLLFHARDCFNPDEYICSQLTYLYLWHACLIPLNVDPEYVHLVTPEMLHLSPIFINKLMFSKG